MTASASCVGKIITMPPPGAPRYRSRCSITQSLLHRHREGLDPWIVRARVRVRRVTALHRHLIPPHAHPVRVVEPTAR